MEFRRYSCSRRRLTARRDFLSSPSDYPSGHGNDPDGTSGPRTDGHPAADTLVAVVPTPSDCSGAGPTTAESLPPPTHAGIDTSSPSSPARRLLPGEPSPRFAARQSLIAPKCAAPETGRQTAQYSGCRAASPQCRSPDQAHSRRTQARRPPPSVWRKKARQRSSQTSRRPLSRPRCLPPHRTATPPPPSHRAALYLIQIWWAMSMQNTNPKIAANRPPPPTPPRTSRPKWTDEPVCSTRRQLQHFVWFWPPVSPECPKDLQFRVEMAPELLFATTCTAPADPHQRACTISTHPVSCGSAPGNNVSYRLRSNCWCCRSVCVSARSANTRPRTTEATSAIR